MPAHLPPTCPRAGDPLRPAVPLVFAPYRFWQLARSLAALGGKQAAVATAPGWAAPLLVLLLACWMLEYGVQVTQLPWAFDWHWHSAAVDAESVNGHVNGHV